MTPFLLALQFLTVIPVSLKCAPTTEAYNRSMGWYPCVGLAIGAPGALLALFLNGHLPGPLVAFVVLLLPILVTGALHLDGFADSCDGLFARRSPQERLAILKDSRLGSFGVIGLIVLLLTRFTALSQLGGAQLPMLALLTPSLARWSIVLSVHWFVPARPGEGLAALFSRKSKGPLVVATVMVAILAVAFLGLWSVAALAGVVIIVLAVGWFATARLGGVTGDTYGATSECAEIAIQVVWAVGATWR